MNVFVTGGSGFIGSHVCQKLSEKHKVITLIRDMPPRQGSWRRWLDEALAQTAIVVGDVLNESLLRRILADYQITTVVHCAAQAIVSTAQEDPLSTFQVNVQGTANLLEACRAVPVQTLYVVSTDKVYGAKTEASEGDPLVSTGIYETSKVCEDMIAQAYARIYGLPIVIGRACNTYGYDLANRIVPNTIRTCMKGESPIIYQGEEAKRQYIYVKDHADAISFLLSKSPKLRSDFPISLRYPQIFNIGTSDILNQTEVVTEICKHYPNAEISIKLRPKPLVELDSQWVNSSRLESYGWCPMYHFADGIDETIKMFEKHGD